jgi:uncharacterized protein YbjQ (UPF0145 family)
MKAKEIAKNNGLDNEIFESWLRQSSYKYKSGVIGGIDIDETQDINEIVSKFKEYYAEKQSAAQKEREERQRSEMEANSLRQRAEQEKQQALASMLITSGFNFDGFTITKYSGYISGDDAVQIDRGRVGMFGGGASNVGDSLLASLVKIRRTALAELKEAAHALGCNAVIGVDFDYLTLDPETANSQGGTTYLPYVFGVTANGNAVIIEKNDRTALS